MKEEILSEEEYSSSCESSVVDDDGLSFKRKSRSSKQSQINNRYLSGVKKPKTQIKIPFEQLRRALDILNAPDPVKIKVNLKCRRRELFSEKTNLFHLNLIKTAILKHEWELVPKLLIDYINTIDVELLSIGLVMRYAFIALLNDPVAKENNFMEEFFGSLISCGNEEDLNNYLRKLMLIPRFGAKFLEPMVVMHKKIEDNENVTN